MKDKQVEMEVKIQIFYISGHIVFNSDEINYEWNTKPGTYRNYLKQKGRTRFLVGLLNILRKS